MVLSSPFYCPTCGAANSTQATSCFACGEFLQVSTDGAIVSSTTSLTGNLASDYLLKQRYRIISQLGQGGFGAIYKAEDIELGNRHVAVKEMSQGGLRSQEVTGAAEAFKREALLLASLIHPSLPRIYDHFLEAGRWYLVMDFIAGETLESYLNKAKDGRLPVEEVVQIGIQLCTVLSYLHNRQPPIIFRDLKPDNIMRTPDGHLYLIDFGIARHFKPGQAKDTIAFGSPGYAAPEQYGKAQTTPRADIYSLGVTLHQALSGSDPSEIPFQFAPLHLQNAELEQLIMQMLDINISKRPYSAATIKQELEQIALGKTTTKVSSTTISASNSISTPGRRSHTLSQSAGMMLFAYRGHTDWVKTVAWSPDGQRIASGGKDDNVQVWDAVTGNTILTYHGHYRFMRHLRDSRQYGVPLGTLLPLDWSPDGRLIASGGRDKTVQIWEATTGKKLLTFHGHSDIVSAVKWSPNGHFIASAGKDEIVQVWEASTGNRIYTYPGHFAWVNSVAWSPNGKRIASAGDNDAVHVWDATSEHNVLIYGGHSDEVLGAVWSPDGKYIASASDDVQVWDAATGQRIITYQGHGSWIWALAWSPDGNYIASGGKDKSVQVWDAATGDKLLTYRGHGARVTAIAWAPDSTRIASASADYTVQVWKAV